MDREDSECTQTLINGNSKPPRDRTVLTIVVTNDGTKIKEALSTDVVEDKWNLVYCIMVIQGIGQLLPWNFFITAHEYFSAKLKGTKHHHDFENYFALAAFLPNIIAFFLNTILKHKVPLKIRILVPLFVISVLFIVTAVLVWIDTDHWKGTFFILTLVTIALINSFCAIVQGGMFGLSGMMPARYTQAMMTGQGLGGILTCVADIGSKLGTSDPIDSAFWYFMTAAVVVIICFFAYLALYRIKFSRYYLLDKTEQIDATDVLSRPRKQTSPHIQTPRILLKKLGLRPRFSTDFSVFGYVVKSTFSYLTYYCSTTVQTDEYSDKPKLTNAEMAVKMKKATPPFMLIFKQIWRIALAVFLVFMVTLALFPAVLSGIKSKHLGDGSPWTGKFFTPVACFLVFNVGDFTGRVMAGVMQKPGKKSYWLLAACVIRFVFLPLFAFCNYQPRRTKSTVYFDEDYLPIIFNVFFSISNGYLGSLCMMYGPTLVESKHAETAGVMMALFLTLGLGVGGGTAFVITKTV